VSPRAPVDPFPQVDTVYRHDPFRVIDRVQETVVTDAETPAVAMLPSKLPDGGWAWFLSQFPKSGVDAPERGNRQGP